MYKTITVTGLLLLCTIGCNDSFSDGRSQHRTPPAIFPTEYASPPSSDEEVLARFRTAFSEGATYDNVGDRVGFSESQRAEYEAGRAQGFRDIYGN